MQTSFFIAGGKNLQLIGPICSVYGFLDKKIELDQELCQVCRQCHESLNTKLRTLQHRDCEYCQETEKITQHKNGNIGQR